MASTDEVQRPVGGALMAAISDHVVRVFAEYTGRGPTRARTTIRDDIVVCVAHQCMTKAERRLVETGEGESVRSLRRTFQNAMREDLVAGVERLSGRPVVSFMSDHDPERDFTAEVFVLAGHEGSR